ncbi:hypothetical protein B1A_11281, partial [mine drainage metagenome]
EDMSLKDLLMQAIRYGDQPEVRARLTRKIDRGTRPRAPEGAS